jgi:CDP-glycerol glycerophosphotransferase
MQSIIGKIHTAFWIFGAWAVYFASLLTPRNPRIWVFWGWHKHHNNEAFADNSKYLFLYSSQMSSTHSIKVCWMTPDKKLVSTLNNRGYCAYHQNSVRGLYFALRAGYTFVDALLTPYIWRSTGRSKIIQLWHGIAMKKIGMQKPNYPFKKKGIYNRILYPHQYSKEHLVITNSPWETKVVEEAFDLNPKILRATEYPRNDVLLRDVRDSEIHSAELIRTKDQETSPRKILYCPTFRPKEDPDGYDPINIPSLEKFLQKHNAILYLQLHPKHMLKNLQNLNNTRIVFLDGAKDIYPRLKEIDICISDYSSLPYDFLLFDRPIIYYQYDYDTYVKNPGLQNDPEKITPGKRVLTFDELLGTLEDIFNGNDKYKEKREQVRNLIFSHRDGRASERIFNLIVQDFGGSSL